MEQSFDEAQTVNVYSNVAKIRLVHEAADHYFLKSIKYVSLA
jgi:hypothetical protein